MAHLYRKRRSRCNPRNLHNLLLNLEDYSDTSNLDRRSEHGDLSDPLPQREHSSPLSSRRKYHRSCNTVRHDARHHRGHQARRGDLSDPLPQRGHPSRLLCRNALRRSCNTIHDARHHHHDARGMVHLYRKHRSRCSPRNLRNLLLGLGDYSDTSNLDRRSEHPLIMHCRRHKEHSGSL